VVDLAGGSHRRAGNADQLLEAALSLPGQVTLQNQDGKLTVPFSAASAVSALLAVSLRVWWNQTP
jgi:hypothetical protein